MCADKAMLETMSNDILEEIFKNKNFDEILPYIFTENNNMIRFCQKITKFTKKTDDQLDLKKINKSDIGFDWEVVANEVKINESKVVLPESSKKDMSKIEKNHQSASKSGIQYSISYFIKGLKVFEKFKQNKSDSNPVLSQIDMEYTKALNYNMDRLPSYIYETFFEVDLETDIDQNITYAKEKIFCPGKSQADIILEISNMNFEKKEYNPMDYKIISPSKKIDMLLQRPEQNENNDKLREENKIIKIFLQKNFSSQKFSYS